MIFKSYASDALEDAMTLAQTKALNSFSFRDCINTITELWGYCYEKICMLDDGFYSTTVQLTQELTHLPRIVKNTVKVYASQEVVGFNRQVYKEAGMKDMVSSGSFHISGNDLYCKDALRRTVWLSYVPEPPFITFTKNNRDPKILTTSPPPIVNNRYGTYTVNNYIFTSLVDGSITVDLSTLFLHPDKTITSFILDYPYVFVTYIHNATGDFESVIFKNVLGRSERIAYNPFDYQGRPSRVRYITAKFNDYTGMSCVVEDQDDGLIKELGWTPDTLLVYPSRIMYNYLVSNMAKRFASINGSTIQAVEEMLASARYEMSAFLKKDKSGWARIDNITRPSIGDFL